MAEQPTKTSRKSEQGAHAKRRDRPPGPRFEMRISTKYAPHEPSEGKPLTCTDETSLKPDQLLELYRYLKLTRLVEERLVNLYRQTKVVGGVFRSLGQEATAVGTAYALQPGDFITPLIRDLGAVLVKGIRPRDIFAQYMAKAWGPSGDRGMSTGAFHEGLNFAAVQRLPLLVIAEYNHFAYSTPTSLQTACRDLAEKAAGYGIPSHIVDGNDVVACYEVTKHAADYARRGGGAVLIEAKTYRRKGHAEHDDQRYVAPDEIEWWEKHNDPVDRFEKYLLEKNVAKQDKLDEIVSEVTRAIEEDCAWAESSPLPEGEKAAYGVFDNSIVPPAFRPPVLEK